MADVRGRHGRLLLAATAGVTAVTGLAGPSSAASDRATVTVGDPAEDAPAVDDVAIPTDPVDVGVVSTPLRFSTGPGVALELADGRRYLDTLELRLTGSDQRLINDLTVDDYVAGVAEMPGRWAGEALKAQAVAARTYAWYQAELGTFQGRGYDICDTVACQVFAGASPQEDGDAGARWRAAVDLTSGEVLLDGSGRPILARYFSTSGGRTLGNEVVFPSSGPRPYLVATDDPYDAISPYHRWQVTFTRDEFETILEAGQRLAATVPVASIERLGDVDLPGAPIRVTGQDGTQVELGSVEFRRFVSRVAPARFPDRFPTMRADGLRPLPATLPSSRFTVDVGEDEVVVDGRGWGHGVGMGQYGARGRAEDGASYHEILAAYYGGLAPTATDDLPERVRVGLSRAAVGSVMGDRPMTIAADGEVVAEHASGPWALTREGASVRLTAPPGWGEPAAASRTEPADLPSQPNTAAVQVAAGVPGLLRLQVTDAGGATVVDRAIGASGPGIRTATWDLVDGDGEPVPDGTYDVTLRLVAADGSTAGAPLPVTVELPARSLERLAAGSDRRRVTPLLGVVALLALGAVLLTRHRTTTRRSR